MTPKETFCACVVREVSSTLEKEKYVVSLSVTQAGLMPSAPTIIFILDHLFTEVKFQLLGLGLIYLLPQLEIPIGVKLSRPF